MKNDDEKETKNDEIILKTFENIEEVKERKLVNLIIEIIVISTLREYYEKSDTIFKIQSTGAEQRIN
ncbi:hypothetical protein [Flavobacterium maritimum]|uniref:hypothetical protein n=1 Tax=Flavobacterium maritimum TaxID=3149042 RepID=UPI0032B39DEE